MAYGEKVTCDGCGKEKQATNHWWIVDQKHALIIIPWKTTLQPHLYKHFCGQECVTKSVSKWMQEQSKTQ